MNSNKRKHVLFIIGSDTLPADVLGQVIENINLKYGGSTLHKGYGSWSESGASFNETYGNVAVETAYQIEVCATEQDFDLDYLKKCFVPAKQWATWVHCEIWETTAAHFNIKEM